MGQVLNTLAFGIGSLCLGAALALAGLFTLADRYDRSLMARAMSTLTVLCVLAISALFFWQALGA